MSSSASQFVGSIPEFYERHLGPAIFEPYAADMATRVQAPEGGAILETACGTGISTRHLLGARAPGVRLMATDLNDAMIRVAQKSVGDQPGLEWRVADAAALPFGSGEFDAVVCQFGMMFFPDKLAGAMEARRVLKPRGCFYFSVWDSTEHNPFGRITHETLCSYFPKDPPQFYRTPFGYYNAGAIGTMLATSGFQNITMDVVTKPLASESALHLATGLIRGNPVFNEILARGEDPQRVEQAVANALAREGGDTPFLSGMQALVVSAQA